MGFTDLAEATHIPSKSLMRMLRPTGNPRADNLFEIVSFLQRSEGVRFRTFSFRAMRAETLNLGAGVVMPGKKRQLLAQSRRLPPMPGMTMLEHS